MRHQLILTVFALTLVLSSCSLHYWAYIRNLTAETAIVDVYIHDSKFRMSLPETIKTANKIIDFKSGHRRFFSDTTQILWVDSSHFKVLIQPQTTVNLEDFAGHFLNSHPTSDISVIVTSKEVTDTLMNGRMDFHIEKFMFKQNGFIPPKPLLYYDIEK